ncbi:hypothetical protein [Microcoleus sp. herbarium2]|uniref:hypothetical protein n=1 Tax=Microcoleus sp. herbarium2 TaxID=3055433 RepID=UPI002FD249D1
MPSLLFLPATGFDERKYFLGAPETVKKINFSGQECLQDCIKKKMIFWVEILAFLGNFCYIYINNGNLSKNIIFATIPLYKNTIPAPPKSTKKM